MLAVDKHRNSLLNSLWLAGWWLVLTGGAFMVTLDAGEPVRFSEHVLANDHRYIFGIATVDIDGDGDLDLTYPDIYSGGGQGQSHLFWLENNGQGQFQRHLIHKDQLGWMERHATGDINGDGRPDVAMIDNRWGRLYWFANPNNPADGPWEQHIITTKCPHAYDVVLSDLDGDGDLDAATSGFASGQINWYENPGKDALDSEWTHRLIDREMTEDARTIEVGDFNMDGRIDLLATAVGRQNRSATDPKHGSQVVWYENLGRETPSGRWKKHTIDNVSRGPCHGHPADVDGDGDLDVVMAHGMRTRIDSKVERHEVVWYENVGDSNSDKPGSSLSWKRHQISRLPFAFEATARDLDGDGDMDVIGTAWANTPRLYGQPVTKPGGDRVVWFENRGGDEWAVHSLQDRFPGAQQVITADLNEDGRPDIIASCDGSWANRKQLSKSEIRWWRNEGSKP